ncbi:MAG: YciI family protein [Hyphomicrobiaceae bacterium]
MAKCFAAIYEHGCNWIPGKSIAEQPLADHVRYLTNLHEQNVVLMGGPFTDGESGLVILEASDTAEAIRIIDDDPAVQSGILTASVREWNRIV